MLTSILERNGCAKLVASTQWTPSETRRVVEAVEREDALDILHPLGLSNLAWQAEALRREREAKLAAEQILLEIPARQPKVGTAAAPRVHETQSVTSKPNGHGGLQQPTDGRPHPHLGAWAW